MSISKHYSRCPRSCFPESRFSSAMRKRKLIRGYRIGDGHRSFWYLTFSVAVEYLVKYSGFIWWRLVLSIWWNYCIGKFIEWYEIDCLNSYTAQKMKFSIKNFFSKCDQIRRKLRIWSHLQKKSLIENFIFCPVLLKWNM